MADAKGKLIVPIGFRDDGTPHALELDDDDYLKVMLASAAGTVLDVDVTSSVLPTGAATEAKQDDVITELKELNMSSPDGSIWLPSAAPASPSGYDDEFDDANFDTSLWTDFDPGGTLTKAEIAAGLKLIGTSAGNVEGIYQDVPAGAEWSIITKVAWLNEQGNDLKAGLLLLEDVANLATSDLIYYAHYRGGAGTGFQVEEYSDYNSYTTGHVNFTSDKMPTAFYLRLRATGTTWYFDWSSDGLGWMDKWSMARAFTPQGFGLCIKVNTSDAVPIFTFFRYSTDVDDIDIVQGRRVNYYA